MHARVHVHTCVCACSRVHARQLYVCAWFCIRVCPCARTRVSVPLSALPPPCRTGPPVRARAPPPRPGRVPGHAVRACAPPPLPGGPRRRPSAPARTLGRDLCPAWSPAQSALPVGQQWRLPGDAAMSGPEPPGRGMRFAESQLRRHGWRRGGGRLGVPPVRGPAIPCSSPSAPGGPQAPSPVPPVPGSPRSHSPSPGPRPCWRSRARPRRLPHHPSHSGSRSSPSPRWPAPAAGGSGGATAASDGCPCPQGRGWGSGRTASPRPSG